MNPASAKIIITIPATRMISCPGRFIETGGTTEGISSVPDAAGVIDVVIVTWEGIPCPTDEEFFAEIADTDVEIQLIITRQSAT